MIEVICPRCKTNNIVKDNERQSIECVQCLEAIQINTIETDASTNVEGLLLKYTKTAEDLQIPTSGKVFFGRSHYGAEIFNKILNNSGKHVISRIHCSIEFRSGKFQLRDEGSKNGTFYGDNKIICSREPQIIEDNSFIYLGEEIFLAKYKYSSIPTVQKCVNSGESNLIKSFKCQKCGNKSKNPDIKCTDCGYKKWVEITEIRL